MANSFFETPILFLIFNRPETTRTVFETIRGSRPAYLYIAADGPRAQKTGEKEVCADLRNEILAKIDWPCEVKTLFREKNLGCKLAVSSALDWFFENVEEGIILEDDCLPDRSFFQFCQELLEKYRTDDRIAMISGNHFGNDKLGSADYYFTKIPHIWGWATWRRTWNDYDLGMSKYPAFKENGEIKNIWLDKKVQNYWVDIFGEVYDDKIDTWDYQLTFSVFLNKKLCVCPNVNLVSNIGFGKDFTNTVIIDKRVTNISLEKINFPLVHPKQVEYSEKNDYLINKFQLKNYRLKKFLKYLGIFDFIKSAYIKLLKN